MYHDLWYVKAVSICQICTKVDRMIGLQDILLEVKVSCVIALGGLGLHLNHLVPYPLDTGTVKYILGPIMTSFEICPFLAAPEPFEYFLENGCLQKISW